MPEIVTDSLGRQVAEAMRRDILTGALSPGEVLHWDELCERFGVSRMPVRDGLQQLTGEGFLVSVGKRGLQVAVFRQQDIEDAFEAAALLHGRLVRRAAERANDVELDQLDTQYELMKQSLDSIDREVLWEENVKFHQHIERVAAAPKLVAALSSVHVNLYVSALFQSEEVARVRVLVYRPVLDAMRSHDAPLAETLAKENVLNSCSDVIEHLSMKGILAEPFN
jgi:DNA-binding GntR family transcriptional regulator